MDIVACVGRGVFRDRSVAFHSTRGEEKKEDLWFGMDSGIPGRLSLSGSDYLSML